MKRKVYRRIRLWAPVISVIGLGFIVFHDYARPLIAEYRHGDEYKLLALNCDLAMHEEAALRGLIGNDPQTERLRLSADVGMMVCHDYDILRKRLLTQGVSEDQLSMLGLEVLEVEQITVQQMVDAHRMDRF
ncbi:MULTISPECIES: TIGR03982 family His-Xaa-Ser system protein [Pseudomonas]|uniref:TIGR03982 family His-Xaa-Ser system protein n=1 Tax=Pseudomonas shahriarae TaxID=2745512 RepID=A0ABT5NCP9_9PSED|nr:MULTISPECIES: TIGR03982 family His-Xaa-Ser system protein [Pseudomonas]MDD0986186.1 TIGR03982 family His-Xaa-Ser system protein [Pseudomonas shahriarae]MDD1030972.1 TIGR03982 family His-Xaa-Ser system protein [Pseudomonas shahriarae]MDY7530780.1 TIGR03982 family His-Xaa-Ser system protein [Pseudomonas sp. Bout1]MEB0184611.1 TIGR03982 family His-Xaa-Ser system protein [Pseudomonas sp. Bout1]MEC4166284.1 TIGR03982 family His-Xaa-Ser system protein [Pseudomonas sp. MS-1(2024)]